MKVLIVDDHAVVRAGLRQILTEGGGVTVGEAGDGPAALEMLRERDWDMVLLDVALPGRNGIDVLKQIKAEWKKLPVLMLSMYSEDQYAIRAFRAGAAGYMTKESASEELLSAVRKVASGGRYVSESVAELLAYRLDGGPSEEAPHLDLSDREYEVLKLIACGRTVSEIAESLALSVKTISTYRSRILEKMGMKTNAELTHYAVTRGLT